jgi:hypothetical protein
MESSETYSKAINQDEHIMAALAHGSILLPMTGVIVPIVIWITQREKSRYVASQFFQWLLRSSPCRNRLESINTVAFLPYFPLGFWE